MGHVGARIFAVCRNNLVVTIAFSVATERGGNEKDKVTSNNQRPWHYGLKKNK